MNAGNLDKRIDIKTPVRNRDSFGQNIPSMETLTSVWAEITPLNGKQLQLAQANTITATATHKIRIRYYPIKAGYHQITYSFTDNYSSKVKTYQVNSAIDVMEEHLETIMLGTEVVS